MTRQHKRRVFLVLDCGLVPVAMVCSVLLTMPHGQFYSIVSAYLPHLPAAMCAAAVFSLWLGICNTTLNDFEANAIGRAAGLAAIVAAVSAVLATYIQAVLPLTSQIVFGTAYFVLITLSRAVLLKVVLAIYHRGTDRCRVLIYGAGSTGMQLASALRNHKLIVPVAFVDDNPALQGQRVVQLAVFSPSQIKEIAAEKQIDRVLLAIPSQSRPKQMQIARRVQKMGLDVQTVPSFSQLIGREGLLDQLTPMHPKSFLGRDEISARTNMHDMAYFGRSVLITGAGGSIGSELCRQVLEGLPAKLVLFELNELALYTIYSELQQLSEGLAVDIVPILGSVTDQAQVRRTLQEHQTQVVLHAAAYKHVPLVEANPLAGLANNVLGTQVIATEAAQTGVERFVLISSDKAVRPANIMGASKRLAELVVQDIAHREAGPKGLAFSIVRFGNVLGSSGSVVPLFQEQLHRGGPLTVTHRDVSRYFMTVQEAVQLVLRAGGMAEGKEVFVLDMGRPVKIAALARQMIETAGYTVRDAKNPDGDIEIKFTGLRPGEKMTEELSYSGRLVGTRHHKVFQAMEKPLSQIEVASVLRDLRRAIKASDPNAARLVVSRWVNDMEAPSFVADTDDENQRTLRGS